MVGFGRTRAGGFRLTVVVAAVLCVLEGMAWAEVRGGTPLSPTDRPAATPLIANASQPAERSVQSIRESLATIDYSRIAVQGAKRPALQASSSRKSSVGRKILGGAIGATAGFFAGGYLGAAIDGDCGGCDDPGLKGALIGAPIGAVTGGILGALIF